MIFHDSGLAAAFERDGFVVVDLLSRQDLRLLKWAWRQLDDGVVKGLPFSVTSMSALHEYRWRVDRAVRAVIKERLSNVLVGYRVLVGLFVNKAAGVRRHVMDLHQDWTFVEEPRYQSIGLWCPLVDVHKRNGCLEVVPGSHRLSDNPRVVHGTRRLFSYARFMPLLARKRQTVPMTAGQAILYSHGLFHGSGPNMTDCERPIAGAVLIPHRAAPQVYIEDQRAPRFINVHRVDSAFLVGYHEAERMNPGRPMARIAYPSGLSRREHFRPVLECGAVGENALSSTSLPSRQLPRRKRSVGSTSGERIAGQNR